MMSRTDFESRTMNVIPAGADGGADLDDLLDEAFGSDRRGRTAYRLRAGTQPIAELSFAARRDDGGIAGSVQCWPVALVCGATGGVHELTLLGPIAVAGSARGGGLGGRLMQAALSAADASGRGAVVLIGDTEYYGRFGFSGDATGGWRTPGPVERRRLLARIDPVLAGRLPRDAALLPLSAVRATRRA